MIFLNNLFGGGGSGGGSGEAIDYVNGSITVTLLTTSFIHGDTFNTSGSTVTYTSPAGETSDVTSAASFEPSNGSTLNIDGENTVRVSYTPEGKDTVYATQIITVAPIPTELYVTLHDNGMRAGETISYKGATVKALMSDRTEKDVSNETLTWSPLEGTQVTNTDSVNVTCSYTENGVTVSGSAELSVTSKILTGITMTLGKTNYFYGENFIDDNTVVTATYSDETTANVKSKCEFLPEVRSKLETSGNVTVFCTYTENAVTKTATGTINVQKVPMELTVKFSDNGFRVDDYLSYTKATVTARWSDGTNSDVTNLCTWSPAAGTILDRAGTQTVTATYHTDNWDISGSSIVNVTDLKLQSIGATFTKKTYKDGDNLDLSGARVTALYDDGSHKDVTANASWSPSSGTTLKKSDNMVTCTYRENNVEATIDIPISVAYVTSIAISGLDTEYDANDTISYDNAVVTATYSNGSTAVVTDSVTWSPSDGHKLETTDTTVRATYRDNSGITHTATQSIIVNDIPVKLEVQMSVTDYEKGDSLNVAGSSIILQYASGEEETLGVNDVTWNPANGTALNTIGTQYITVTYTRS